MKRNSYINLIGFIAVFILFNNSLPEPRNPPLGNTGAPGETSCMPSGCHSGGSFSGTVTIGGIPDTVLAEQVYDLTLTNTSAAAIRSGFQLTALDINNKFTGTLTGNTEVNVSKDNGTNRTYARQALAKNFNTGQVNWTFKWKAPATVTDDKFNFYFTGMLANGDGDKSKDNSVKSFKTIFFKIPTATQDIINPFESFQVYHQNSNLVILGLENHTAYQYAIYNLNGLILKSGNLNSSIAVPDLMQGIYVLRLYNTNSEHSTKIYIK